MEQTGNISLLKRWWNPLPVKMFDTEPFFNDVKRIIKNENSKLNEEKYKLISYNRILILDRLLKTMSLLMEDYNTRAMFGWLVGEVVDESDNLQFYIRKVKDMTGIVIKDIDGLDKLKKEVQRLLDKYIERFTEKEKKKTYEIMYIFMAVFGIMEIPMNEKMTLYEFGNQKKLADEKIKSLKKNVKVN